MSLKISDKFTKYLNAVLDHACQELEEEIRKHFYRKDKLRYNLEEKKREKKKQIQIENRNEK